MDPYGGTDTVGMFPLFFKRTADVLAPRLSVVFRRLLRLGSFHACWRKANVTPIPKSPSSSSVANYRPISITPVLSKAFERQVAVHIGRFMEHCGVLPTTEFAYRKGLGTRDAFLYGSYTAECIGERQEARIEHFDFSAAFDRLNHQGILYKLSSLDIEGSLLSVLTLFLSNRSQYVLVDGCRSKMVNVVSGVPQGGILGTLLFLLYTSELFSILENKLIGYVDDSTLMAVVPSPDAPVTVAESLNRDLVRVNTWCDLWGMKLNASKTKTMIVSRSRTMHPRSPPLIIDGTVLTESDDLDVLGVTFDSKLTFEKHLRSVSRAASQRLGILRKSWRVFHDKLLIGICF